MISGGEINIKTFCEGNKAVSEAGQVTECEQAVQDAYLDTLTGDCNAAYGNKTPKDQRLAKGCLKAFGGSVWESPFDVDAKREWDTYHNYYTRHGLGGHSAGDFFKAKVEEFAATLKKEEKKEEIDLSDPLAAAKKIVKGDSAAKEELKALLEICSEAEGEAQTKCVKALASILEQIIRTRGPEGLKEALKNSDEDIIHVKVKTLDVDYGSLYLESIDNVKRYLGAVAGTVEEDEDKDKDKDRNKDKDKTPEPRGDHHLLLRLGITPGPDGTGVARPVYVSTSGIGGSGGTDVCTGRFGETCGSGADGTNPDFTPAGAERSEDAAGETQNSDFTPAAASVYGARRMGPAALGGTNAAPASAGADGRTKVDYDKIIGALLEIKYAYGKDYGFLGGFALSWDYFLGDSSNSQVTGYKNTSSQALNLDFVIGAMLARRFEVSLETGPSWQFVSDPIPTVVDFRGQPQIGQEDLGLRDPGATFGWRYAVSVGYCMGDKVAFCVKPKVGYHQTVDRSNVLEADGLRFQGHGLTDRWFAELALMIQWDILGSYATGGMFGFGEESKK